MKLMCEIMAQDILPVVRSVMSKELINEQKMNQNDVARILGVSQPAISQYMRQLRGKNPITITDEEKFYAEIKNLCKKINGMNEPEITEEMNNICKMGAAMIKAPSPISDDNKENSVKPLSSDVNN